MNEFCSFYFTGGVVKGYRTVVIVFDAENGVFCGVNLLNVVRVVCPCIVSLSAVVKVR